MELHTLTSEISRIYRSIDRKITRLQHAATIACQEGCGACCESPHIEATVLETLPLAEAVFNFEEEEYIIGLVEEKISLNDPSCALFHPELDKPGNGRCSYYAFRPLLCRLFGFAARRNRKGDLEFSTCRRIKGTSPDSVERAHIGVSAGLRVPVFQESFMRIAAMNPAIGFQRHPINFAIKEAIEYLYWRRPGKEKMAKAC